MVKVTTRHTVEECIRALQISRATFFRRLRDGAYDATRDRGRTFMTDEQLQAALEGGNNEVHDRRAPDTDSGAD